MNKKKERKTETACNCFRPSLYSFNKVGTLILLYVHHRNNFGFISDMRNSFNLLLIALATFDNIYLFGGFITQISLIAGQQFTWQIVLFPYLLYPLNTIAMTGSIFLTVAIALERYCHETTRTKYRTFASSHIQYTHTSCIHIREQHACISNLTLWRSNANKVRRMHLYICNIYAHMRLLLK